MLIELIYRGGLETLLTWLGAYPKQAIYLFLFLFLLNGVLLLLNYKFFFLLSIIINTTFCILAFSSFIKEKLRGDPLLPTELKMVDEAKNMLSYFSNLSTPVWLLIITAIVLYIAFVIFVFIKIKNTKISKQYYIVPGIFFILFTSFVYHDLTNQNGLLKKAFDITVNPYNQKENYHNNGVLLSFIRNIYGIEAERPSNYSKKSVENLIKDIEASKAFKGMDDSEKPNIIIIQSEAFWDPTVVDTVNFNKDPLPYFHELSEKSTSGLIHVPVFGGNTVNTEFEVLTGMSNQFLPPGSIPYTHFIKEPIPALPNILRGQGYQTTAIHPYQSWFYQRDQVYKYLGFDNFLSLEFFPNPIQDLFYYRDKEITDEIIKKIETSDKPNFIYAITMQNHGPYKSDSKKYYASMEAELNIPNKIFTPEAENILEFQTDNLVEIDKELERLISYLQSSERKTIVAYFGDHLPLLGDDYLVYKEMKYFQNDQTYEGYLNMFQTPLLIWNNFDNQEKKIEISSVFLGPYLLDLAGLKGYYFTDYLNELRRAGKTFLPRFDYLEYSKLNKGDIEIYEELQYDIMFGSKYGLVDNQVPITPSKTYRLGYGDPNIDSATVTTTEKGERAVLLKGNYFTTSCQVYINGEAVGSNFIDENTIYAIISKDMKPTEVIMKIFDSENKVLSVSNKITKIKLK
jgi:phosphoglycerol transferase MdoB-like AlkP superfamily enzyme